MKTFLIVSTILAATLSQPTQMDYIPPTTHTTSTTQTSVSTIPTEITHTPATPDPSIYAIGIESDLIDLNTICSWQENIEPETTTLTLYTYDGNFYVLEMPTVYP